MRVFEAKRRTMNAEVDDAENTDG